MRTFLFLLLVSATACSSAQHAEPESSRSEIAELEAILDAIVREELELRHQPGVAVVIVQDGETLIKRGWGVANVETGQPVDPDKTLFRIGSVSKALTGLALARLIDRGVIGMEDDVAPIIDGIRNVSGGEAPVTVRNLLTHTGGFDQIGGFDRQIRDFHLPLDRRMAMRPSLGGYLADDRLRRVTPPGHVFRYDTFGITLAGHVAAEAVGLTYAEMMRQELFEPIGMTRSFVEADAEHRADLARGYGWVDGEFVEQPYEVYVTTPASSIDATPADMGRLLEVLTGGGANAHGRLFSEETAAAVLAPQYRAHPDFAGATHGMWESTEMDIPSEPQVRTVGHGGSLLGYATSFSVYTEPNVGVFVVTNRNFESGGGPDQVRARVAQAIVDAFYDRDVSTKTFPETVAVGDRDLREYAHDFYDGVHCRTCTDAEFAAGAWPRRPAQEVRVTERGLRIGEHTFLPTADPDVFVRSDNDRAVFFGREASGRVSYFVYSTSPYAFERLSDAAEAEATEADALHEDISRQLAHAAEQSDTADVSRLVADALQRGLDGGIYNEDILNAFGYEYLQAKAVAMAVAVFAFNAEAFPLSWNVHDSLGEGLAAAGRTAEAIAAYERSLELNPDNTAGRDILERLRAE
ncbi:MAG: serine hydrolase [Bacteroidota bacterium]